MFKVKTKTITCPDAEALENFLKAHYVVASRTSLARITDTSYSVRVELCNILNDVPEIYRYEVTILLSDWNLMVERAERKDVLDQIFSGEFFDA